MKTMKQVKFIIIFLGVITASSCSKKYLERFPLDSPSTATFLSSEAELDMAVTGSYQPLQFIGEDAVPFILTLEYVSDNGWERNPNQLQIIGKGIATSDNGYAKTVWDALYVGVSRCNFILSNADRLNGVVAVDKLDRVLGEVRFLRAYYYFYLNEVFGGVPLLTKTVSLAESQVARNTKEEVVNFIISEMDAIASALPVVAGQMGRVTRGASLELKSRTALFNKKWDAAAKAASDLMQLGSNELHGNYGEIFTYSGMTSREIIFAIQYLRSMGTHGISRRFYSRTANGFSSKVPAQVVVDSYECTDGLTIDKSPLYDPAKPWDNRDPRLNFSVVLPQTRFIGYVFETHPDSLLTWDYNGSVPQRVANADAINPLATFTGYLWRKYASPEDLNNIDQPDVNVIVFRYAEILLNYAEAKVELNQIDQSVYDAINLIRERPSVSMPPIAAGKTQDEMRFIVRRERRSELAGEGVRWFDIRRWELAETVMNGPLLGRIRDRFLSNAPRVDENGLPHYENVTNADMMRVIETRTFKKDRDNVWPIPQLELETNKALVQNPNY